MDPCIRDVQTSDLPSRTPPIPVRSVSSFRSLFDLAGSSSCASNYSHGRELAGKSSVLALQVPASSLPPPLTASAVVHIGNSTAFFPSLQSSEQRLLDRAPSTREGMRWAQCEPSQPSHPASTIRGGNHANSEASQPSSSNRGPGGIVRRLSEVLQGRGDEDLILQPTDRDDMMLQWLQALDLHVVGACRADERLRPMLRWNMSCSGDEGRFLAHLSQHFKARELGLLARCLCAPLVTVRVGEIQRQGRFLCPTSSRGYLSLTMLPYSEMRLSFVGDNGSVERIASIRSGTEDPYVVLEMLLPDSSGKSFVLKLAGNKHAYYWQSEKSKSAGDRLLSEMKDLLTRRPTLSQLTGVHESRLDAFVSQLRSAVVATSSSPCFQQSSNSSFSLIGATSTSDTNSVGPSSPLGVSFGSSSLRQSQRMCWSRTSPARIGNNQPLIHGRNHSGNQVSLSPRASGFKEGAVRGTANARSVISSREKHRRRIDSANPAGPLNLCNGHSCQNTHNIADLDVALTQPLISTHAALSIGSEDVVHAGTHSAGLHTSLHGVPCMSSAHEFSWDGNAPFPKQIFSLPLGSSSVPASPSLLPSLFGGSSFNPSTFHPPTPSHLPISTSTILAPYYCPCPLRSSALQYAITPPFLPSTNEVSAVPCSSSFFSVKPSSAFLSQTTLSLDRVSLSPIPLPVSSLVNIPTPLQTANLPPFFSDPIVHIPVIDFQSATQSFLVSAPPAIASPGITPVLPSFLTSVLPRGEGLSDGNFLTSMLPHVEGFSDGQELPALNILQGLGTSSYKLEDKHRDANDVQPLLIDTRFRALLASFPERRPVKDDPKQEGWCAGFESSRNSVHDVLSQHSGPLLGVVPAILTSGSVSCVLNFCQERSMKSTWVSGSRGLYCGTCEPGIPAPSIASCSSSLQVRVREADICQTSNQDTGSENMDAFLGRYSNDRDDKVHEEEDIDKFDTIN